MNELDLIKKAALDIANAGATVARLADEVQKTRELAESNAVEIREVKQLAIEAKLDAQHACDYCALATYFQSKGIYLTTADASRHGLAMTERCNAKGIKTGSTPHERWGRINTYPRVEMDGYIKEVFQ